MPNPIRNLFREADAWLSGVQSTYLSTCVTYKRGTSSTRMPAQYTKQVIDVQETTGIITRIEVWKFNINTDVMKLDNTRTDPKSGDMIVTDTGEVYQVQAMPGQDCWSWASVWRTSYSIFTKFISKQP